MASATPRTSTPWSSMGTGTRRAPRARNTSIVPLKLGDSTTTASPGRTVSCVANVTACCAPVVTSTFSGSVGVPSDVSHSASASRRAGRPAGR